MEINCQGCNTAFTTSNKSRRYCTSDCRAATVREIKRRWAAENPGKANRWKRENPDRRRETHRVSARRRREEDPEKYREQYRRVTLKRMYGITVEQYDEMFTAQDGKCAICRQECTSGRALAVDHDHACCPGSRACGGCIRGLLCFSCNLGIGQFSDDIARLRAAVSYLEKF